MSKLNIKSTLTVFVTLFSANVAFAEPPLQAGDTLESLSKVKIETTVNGQPSTLSTQDISKSTIPTPSSDNESAAISPDAQAQINQTTATMTSEIPQEQVDPNAAAIEPQQQVNPPEIPAVPSEIPPVENNIDTPDH